jgi:hypothetical protein
MYTTGASRGGIDLIMRRACQNIVPTRAEETRWHAMPRRTLVLSRFGARHNNNWRRWKGSDSRPQPMEPTSSLTRNLCHKSCRFLCQLV